MSEFKVGYAQTIINPPLGIFVRGYYKERFAKGFLDDIEASVLVAEKGSKKLAIISIDSCGLTQEHQNVIKSKIEKTTPLKNKDIFLSTTHTHTAPGYPHIDNPQALDVFCKYLDDVADKVAFATKQALDNMSNAKMGYAITPAPNKISFIRRYKMKDGSTWTCPPVGDENIVGPIGELDTRVNIVRFDRENAPSIVIVNYGIHADTTNGDLLSADFPHWLRLTVEKALDGTKCMFLPGAEGDVGSTNMHPTGGDMNDTEISFDNEMKSPGMARHVGRALAGSVLYVYDKVNYVDVDDINIMQQVVTVKANVPNKKDMPRAKKFKELHESGKDCEIPYTAMELTTVVAEALRMCRMENGPYTYDINLTGVKFGPVAFVGIPGEPFTDIGVDVKKSKGWELILPCALVNGDMGYFPVKSAFDEGGYEARTSPFTGEVASKIVEGAYQLLNKI